MDHLPSPPTTESFIGITVAIAGNVLISFALNCQKLAHMRLERLKEKNAEQGNDQGYGSTTVEDPELGNARQVQLPPDRDRDRARAGRKYPFPSSSPLAPRSNRNSLALDLDSPPASERPQGRLQRINPSAAPRMSSPARASRLNIPPITPRTIPEDRPASDPDPASLKDDDAEPVATNEAAYLKSKLWLVKCSSRLRSFMTE
jgi:magnesium transporter